MTRQLLTIAFVCAGCSGGQDPVPPDPVPDPAPETLPDPAPEPTPDPAPDPAPTFKAGPDGFPMPADADGGTPAPGGGGMITVYNVPRGKSVVEGELRANLKAEGWTIDSDETSPRGATRMDISKDGKKLNVRLTGDDAQTAIILTVSKP